jgi:hypothetical protein
MPHGVAGRRNGQRNERRGGAQRHDGCAKDPAKPIDLELVRALDRDFATADRAAREEERERWKDLPEDTWSRAG